MVMDNKLLKLLLDTKETLECCEGYVNSTSRSPSMLEEVQVRVDAIKKYIKEEYLKENTND